MGRRRGHSVETASGKRGFIWNDEKLINGKHRVYIEEDLKPTGEKILVKPDDLKVTGYIN